MSIFNKKLSINKFALGIEYNGSRYCGWQRQYKLCSIQESLENALSKIANHSVRVFCSGRTDAGVHSTGQVIHFNTTAYRQEKAWTHGVNANLPDDISVRWVKSVAKNFHARFSAKARRYRYIICNQQLRPAIFSRGVTHFYHPLDTEKMQRAGEYLLGENDFTSFRATHCQSYTPMRNLLHLKVNRVSNYVVVDIKANAFLYHMVRNIVGSLILIGAGNKPEEWMASLLAAKDRRLAAATASPDGLYLVSVDYPLKFKLPLQRMIGPLFLGDVCDNLN